MKTCEDCGLVLQGRQSKFCSKNCQTRTATRRYRERNNLNQPKNNFCKECGKEFLGQSNKIFCSKQCKRSWELINYRENRRLSSIEYRKTNKFAVAIRSNSRKKRLKQATPKWLKLKDKYKIEEFYIQAKDCSMVTGEQYEVDHIIPLKGKNVCGLHVPWNLQVLPMEINRRKSASYDH